VAASTVYRLLKRVTRFYHHHLEIVTKFYRHHLEIMTRFNRLRTLIHNLFCIRSMAATGHNTVMTPNLI
jgi:hypothetical protein